MIANRFWSKVNKAGPIPAYRPDLGPCWLWVAGTNRKGYGQFWGSRHPGIAVLNSKKTHCPQKHPYDAKNTLLYQGRRYCRACKRAWHARFDNRLKRQVAHV